MAAAEWTAIVETSTSDAYIGAPFTCSVLFQNTGDYAVIVQSVVFTIQWPSSFPDWPDPTEHHLIFEGNETVGVGMSFVFEKVITSNLWGGFSTVTSIRALSVEDGVVVEHTYSGNILLKAQLEAPGYVDLSFVPFLIIGLLFVVAFAIRLRPWSRWKVDLGLTDSEAEEFKQNVHKLARLRPGELILLCWLAKFDDVTVPNQMPETRDGVLLATDQRFFLFSKARRSDAYRSSFGIPPATAEGMFKWAEIEIDEISEHQVVTGMGGAPKITLRYWSRGMVIAAEFWYIHDLDQSTLKALGKTGVDDLRRFVDSVIGNRVARLKEEAPRVEKRRLVDFSTLRERMAREGMDMKTFRCPSCGGDIAIPPSGMTVRCQYCGSMLYSTELLDR